MRRNDLRQMRYLMRPCSGLDRKEVIGIAVSVLELNPMSEFCSGLIGEKYRSILTPLRLVGRQAEGFFDQVELIHFNRQCFAQPCSAVEHEQ